jgi:hypothetical protein
LMRGYAEYARGASPVPSVSEEYLLLRPVSTMAETNLPD